MDGYSKNSALKWATVFLLTLVLVCVNSICRSQLLTLSHKNESSVVPVDLNYSLKHVMKICKNTFDKCIDLIPDYSDIPALVMADPIQIEQALLNLCINASHAMTIMRPKEARWGGVLSASLIKITYDPSIHTCHPRIEGQEYWVLSINDQGVGIPPETKVKIFEPLFTTKQSGMGSGLGLVMVNNIVRRHEGVTDIHSKIDKGTTFKIILPAVEYQSVLDDQEEKKVVRGGAGTILIVDDEKDIRTMIAGLLEECGYSVILAKYGEEAVVIFRERDESVDAVLLDIKTPYLSGLKTLEAMLAIKPDACVADVRSEQYATD